MAETPLASEEDVAAALGRELTSDESAQVEAALDQASALFRRRSGQNFTPGESLVRLKVNGGVVRLAQSPVTSITSVTDDDGTAVPYDHFGLTLTVPRISHQFVRVNYQHGADEVPDAVRLCVASVVSRLFSVDSRAKSGLTQFNESTGPFSEGGTFASWAVGGQVLLAPADQQLADSYRAIRPGNSIVQRP